jgi:hypothetical protein
VGDETGDLNRPFHHFPRSGIDGERFDIISRYEALGVEDDDERTLVREETSVLDIIDQYKLEA